MDLSSNSPPLASRFNKYGYQHTLSGLEDFELPDQFQPEKYTAIALRSPGDAAAFAPSSAAPSDSVSEALEALMVLGYTQGETAPILGKLDPSMSTQDLIKETLRLLTAKNMR